jgi:phosphoribosyl-ATP pyrophosphohydrolase/phosphoribosyl-AMP cyclohydrolase
MLNDEQEKMRELVKRIKMDELGLVPAIIQDELGEVLMLAYMNEASLQKTIETGTTWFFSRSRKKLWNKGETSGNFQYVKSITYDCDADTLLLVVRQKGVACHEGTYSCFKHDIYGKKETNVLRSIADIIEDRRINPKEGSYTNYLLKEGIDKILKKIGEESAETIIAAKGNDKGQTIYEMSDFIYHALVLMNYMNIDLEEIRAELIKRFKK